EENAREIVIVKNERALATAGADDHLLGAYLQQAVSLKGSDQIPLVKTEHGAVLQDANAGMARDRSAPGLKVWIFRGFVEKKVTAQTQLPVDKENTRAGCGCLQSRCHPRRPA